MSPYHIIRLILFVSSFIGLGAIIQTTAIRVRNYFRGIWDILKKESN